MVFKKQHVGALIDELGGYVGLRYYKIFDGQEALYAGQELLKFHESLKKLIDEPYIPYRSLLAIRIVGELWANAESRGNKSDPNAILSLKLIECQDGYIVRIRDSGQGFDPEEKLAQMLRGEIYYQRAGSGIRHAANPEAEVTYENNATTWNIVIRKGTWDLVVRK